MFIIVFGIYRYICDISMYSHKCLLFGVVSVCAYIYIYIDGRNPGPLLTIWYKIIDS